MMGIRFYCPNGHKLNVKAHLAGRRGICPYCGTRLLIPLKSTRPSSKEDAEKKQGTAPNSQAFVPDSQVFGFDSQAIAPNSIGNLNDYSAFFDDKEQSGNVADAESLTIDFVAIDEENGENDEETAEQSETAKSIYESALDDPNAVWYVQLPDGQRFGPATSPILQSWIAEKRISPNMLVWREDWNNWVDASLVFPEIKEMFQK
jgi:hypothetical protein